MKNILKLSFTLLALTLTNQYFAQISLGLRAGINYANVDNKDFDADGFEKLPIAGLNFGVFGEMLLTKSLFFETGLYLSGKGFKFSNQVNGNDFKQTIAIQYLEIPLYTSFKTDLGKKKLNIFAGPYIGIAASGNIKTITISGDTEEDIKFGNDKIDDTFKRTDFGLNFGAGIQSKNILIRAQYGLGLSNMFPDPDSGKSKNGVVGISVSFTF